MTDFRETHRALPCACGHRACSAWLVSPAAYVQGVRFTRAQARAVAVLLNAMEFWTARRAVALASAAVAFAVFFCSAWLFFAA